MTKHADLESLESSTRREYSLVGQNEQDVDEGQFETDNRETKSSSSQGIVRILHTVWLPEETVLSFQEQHIFDSVASVRLLKFIVITLLLIGFVHKLIRWLDMEHDEEYTLNELMLYDLNLIGLDIIVFFFVGRLHQQERGVDHLAWVLVAFVGSIYTSFETTLPWLQHSLTLYDMHCFWPWQLWAFFMVVVPLCSTMVVQHIRHAIRMKQLCMKLLEIGISAGIFLLPIATHPNFHFHHWFAGWLLGMHCNFDTWWSRACMAWCWGQYINGVAVYGRDPQLTCAIGFYVSRNARCSFLSCFTHQVDTGDNQTHAEYNLPAVPDWRNCSTVDAP